MLHLVMELRWLVVAAAGLGLLTGFIARKLG